MPRLLLFVPCDRVIVDQDGIQHLISILQQWTAERIRGNPPDPIPETDSVPQKWEIFTLWHRLPQDQDKDFVQTCELITPSGQIAFSSRIEFKVTERAHRNTIRVLGMPVAPGEYEIRLYLSEKGAEKEREAPLSSYPLLVLPPVVADLSRERS